jgi:hypothetical protein
MKKQFVYKYYTTNDIDVLSNKLINKDLIEGTKEEITKVFDHIVTLDIVEQTNYLIEILDNFSSNIDLDIYDALPINELREAENLALFASKLEIENGKIVSYNDDIDILFLKRFDNA